MSTTTKNVGRVSIVPKGDWNINNTYIRLDLVTYDGNSYIAKKDVPKNIQLSNNNYWMLMASKGASFAIVKSYASIAAMNADFSNTNVQNGQFVIIDTGNVQDPDNAKLYYKGSNSYVFVTDLSGAAGIQGPRGASAYEQAVAGGYTDTEAQFNEDLASFKELSDETKEVAPFYAKYGVTTNVEIETANNGKRQLYAFQIGGPGIFSYAGAFSYYDTTLGHMATGHRFSLTRDNLQWVYELTNQWRSYTYDLNAPAQRAEVAQGLAEDAQEAAETAAQSVSQSAAQISQNASDISDLKSAVPPEELELIAFSGLLSGSGAISSADASKKETYTEFVKVSPGDKIKIEVTNPDRQQIYLAVVERKKDMSFVQRYPVWNYSPSWDTSAYSEKIYTVPADIYAIAFTQRTYGTQTYKYLKLTFDVAANLSNIDNTVSINHANVVKPRKEVISVNHRGWYECPEETAIAYKESSAHGFVYVEGDIRRTSDGVPVMLHDATINRTARNADGSELADTIAISSITYEQALEYDFGIYKGAAYAGIKILTLDEFLKLCRNLGLIPYIELESASAEYINSIVEVIKANGNRNEVVFISNYVGALYQMQDHFPDNRYGVCPFSYTNQFFIQANILKNGRSEVFFDMDITQISSSVLANMQNRNYPLEAWVVDTESAIVNADKYITGFTSNTLNAAAVLSGIPELSGDVDDLKSAFYSTLDDTNLFDKDTVTDGKRLGTTGNPVTATDYFVSAFIPVAAGKTYIKNSPTEDGYHRLCVYDSSNRFIPNAAYSSNLVTIPAGGVSVRFCGEISEKETATLILVSPKDVQAREDIDELSDRVDNLNTTFIAEYGVTTFNEINSQVQAGNFVAVKLMGLGGNYYATLNGTSFGERGFGTYTAYHFDVPPSLAGQKLYFTEYEISSDEGWATENTNIDTLNAGLVSQFTYNKAYNIGDYVVHNGTIYKFITTHAANNYWNTNEVIQTVLADDISDLKSTVDAGLEILSYGNSTWADFLSAYTAHKIVYCKASSAADPSSGDQTRLAFMAFVNNAENPTSVEFQYYRSVSSHSDSQQGDQVFVYKLDKTAGWFVTTRDTFTTIAVGDGLSKTYSNGTITLNADDSNLQKILQMDTPVLRNGSIGNAGNANAVSTTYALPTNGAKRVRVTMLHPKTAESDYYYWVVAFYNEAGGASSSTAQRIIDIDPYTYTHENTMVFDLNDTAAFAVTVFEYSESGSAVPLRVADVGNCLRIQYEYDVTDYPIIPGIGKGSMGNPNSTTAVRTSLATPLPEKFGYIKVDIKRTNIPDDVQFFYSVWAFNKTLIKTTDTNSRVAHLDNQSVDGTSFYIPSIFFPATSKSFGLTIYAKQDGQTFTLKGSNVGDFIRMHFINVPDVTIEDAYTRNKDKDSMLAAAVRYGKKSNNGKDFCILEITDSHSDPIAEQNSIQIANGFKYIDTLIHCGDFCADKAGNFNSEIYDRFIACEKSFYFVCGNHDVGNRKTVADCIDTATVYTRYIKPIVDAGLLASGEYQTGKSYYYHDFNDYNIRLICVYEYDDPNDLNPSNSAEYRINRGYSVISQAQAEWFCDTLISTPSGYSVVVAMHSAFSNLAIADTSLKFTESSKSGADHTQRLFSTDFWADAVNAFVTRSSYTCDMICTGDAVYLNDSSTGKYYSFTKNFSSAVGSFLCFIGGHGHRDRIFVHPTYSYQKQVIPVCANTVNYLNSANSDIRRTSEDSPSKDSLTAIGCDTENKKIRLVKIGVNVTENMTRRDFEMIDVS